MILKRHIKEVIAATIAAVLLMMTGIVYTGQTDAANTAMEYLVFDKEGNPLRTYTMEPVGNYNNTRGVIGTDDRELDHTTNGIVKLFTYCWNNNGPLSGIGTGFVVDDHTIATAAHCVYSPYERKGKSLIVYLAIDGDVSLALTAKEVHVPKLYADKASELAEMNIPEEEKYVPNSDYALITVEEDLSDYMYFNLGVPMDSIIDNTDLEVSVTGFPKKVSDNIVNNESILDNMYTSTGSIVDPDLFSGIFTAESEFLYYDADTSEGNSGGPVYITESRCGHTYNTVIAINVSDWTDKETEKTVINIGTCIDTNILRFLTNNPNINY